MEQMETDIIDLPDNKESESFNKESQLDSVLSQTTLVDGDLSNINKSNCETEDRTGSNAEETSSTSEESSKNIEENELSQSTNKESEIDECNSSEKEEVPIAENSSVDTTSEEEQETSDNCIKENEKKSDNNECDKTESEEKNDKLENHSEDSLDQVKNIKHVEEASEIEDNDTNKDLTQNTEKVEENCENKEIDGTKDPLDQIQSTENVAEVIENNDENRIPLDETQNNIEDKENDKSNDPLAQTHNTDVEMVTEDKQKDENNDLNQPMNSEDVEMTSVSEESKDENKDSTNQTHDSENVEMIGENKESDNENKDSADQILNLKDVEMINENNKENIETQNASSDNLVINSESKDPSALPEGSQEDPLGKTQNSDVVIGDDKENNSENKDISNQTEKSDDVVIISDDKEYNSEKTDDVVIISDSKEDDEKTDDVVIISDTRENADDVVFVSDNLTEKVDDVVIISDSKENNSESESPLDQNEIKENKEENKETEKSDQVEESSEKKQNVAENEDILDKTQNTEVEKSKENQEGDSDKVNKDNADTKTKASESEAQNKEGQEDSDFMDEDFDPSLLCPEVSMDVEEGAVNTNSYSTPNDGTISPLLYEPVFETLVDEMTGAEVGFNLTPQEQELRSHMFGSRNPIQTTRVHCTACNVHLGSALDAQKNRFIHPMLKVLVCKECYNFYCSGEFEKDEDGSELYCRWCGQGGQVFCCSKCEFVFCKKCVRNNFGRKKLSEVRDSDEWSCFRCEPSQLASLRAHVSELFDYVRTEISRAATLNIPSFLTTDHTTCCTPKKPKTVETEPKSTPEPVRKKRKLSDTDPDYAPTMDEEESPPAQKQFKPTNASPGVTVIPPVKNNAPPLRPIIILPRNPGPATGFQGVVQPPLGQTIRVGNTTFRQRPPGFTTQRPVNQQTVRTSTPGYIRILPQNLQRPPVRMQRPATPITPVRPQNSQVVNNQMKHEWFEKTVRAAARVNSNLSYTLTQLNRAQSQANSVEGLAVVHNKLQEILSTSINSLIQIRKNLRTEFIAGIKKIKFPAKETQNLIPMSTSPITIPDDDVILVNPSAMPPNPPPLIRMNFPQLPPAVTLTPRSPPKFKDPLILNSFSMTTNVYSMITSSASVNTSSAMTSGATNMITSGASTSTGGASTSTSGAGTSAGGASTSTNDASASTNNTNKEVFKPPLDSNGKPKFFLKVKSFSDLQNVSSDCITIPDEPEEVKSDPVEDPLKIDHPIETKTTKTKVKPNQPIDDLKLFKTPTVVVKREKIVLNGTSKEEKKVKPRLTYNMKEVKNPPPDLKRILAAKVFLKRSAEIDKICKKSAACNGNVSN